MATSDAAENDGPHRSVSTAMDDRGGARALEALRGRILTSLDRCAAAEPALKDAADRIFVRYILGEAQPDMDVAQFMAELKLAQDPDSGKLADWHSFGMSLRALNMIGAKPPVPFAFLRVAGRPERLVELIRGLDWTRPWRSSIDILHAVTPVALVDGPGLAEVMAALEAHQAANGGWGPGCPAEHQLAAAFHFLPIYQALARPVPRLQELGRLASAMRFTGLQGFLAMDAAYVVRAAVAAKALSRAEAEPFFAHLEAMLTADGVDFGDRHGHVAAAQLVFILSEWRGPSTCRDAWASGLWQIR